MAAVKEKNDLKNHSLDESKFRNDSDTNRSDSEMNRSSSEESRSDLELVGVEDEGNCGYGSCEPKFLRCCNNAKGFLVVYCFLVIVQGTPFYFPYHMLFNELFLEPLLQNKTNYCILKL